MSDVLACRATFTAGNMERLLDLYASVRIFAAVQKSQRIVEAESHAHCPVASGELDGSIHSEEPIISGREVRGQVVASAAHAGFVEFGTGLRGAGTYPYPLPQEGVPITGDWEYDYRGQGWLGHGAHPYLRPALDTARAEVLSEFQQEVK